MSSRRVMGGVRDTGSDHSSLPFENGSNNALPLAVPAVSEISRVVDVKNQDVFFFMDQNTMIADGVEHNAMDSIVQEISWHVANVPVKPHGQRLPDGFVNWARLKNKNRLFIIKSDIDVKRYPGVHVPIAAFYDKGSAHGYQVSRGAVHRPNCRVAQSKFFVAWRCADLRPRAARRRSKRKL